MAAFTVENEVSRLVEPEDAEVLGGPYDVSFLKDMLAKGT
jgi:hypothetical protein